MKRILTYWNPREIGGKLRIGFGALFVLIALLIATWLLSLSLANQARNTITASAAIERTVLNMDRLLEKARRLHGDFFLQYNRIGLAEAHVQFAQPSVRLMSEAIAASEELKKRVEQSEVGESLRMHHVDLNLYLASAQRFANTSIESIELITRLAAPENGLEAKFARLSASLQAETTHSAPLSDLYRELAGFYQQYQISRQRHLMQSAFNRLHALKKQSEASASPSPRDKRIRDLATQLENVGEDLLATDLAIKNKFHDFNLQAGTMQPIAQTLVKQAGIEVERVQATVTRTLRMAASLLAVFALAALGASLLVSRFITRSITGRIKELRDSAAQLQKGHLDLTVAEEPNDELGDLGRTFNLMSGRIRELVDDLELKIEQRTFQLAESERRFRHIANELPNVGIIGFDQDRRIFFWNQTCERLYGACSREAVGREVELLIADEAEQPALCESLRLWSSDPRLSLPAGETRFRRRDGGAVQVFASSFIITNAQGRQEMYCIHIDLTELKAAQKESALRESVYRSLFDCTSSGVTVLAEVDEGRDFTVKDLNRAAQQLEGAPRQELVNRRLSEIFPETAPTGLLAALQSVWRTGTAVSVPPMLYQYAHRHCWRQGHIYKIPTGDIVFVYDDITRLKEAELERATMETKLHRAQKMEAIGLLAGGVAHDLNNILSGIVSYPELILMQLDQDSKLRKSVMAIQASGQRAAAVVADLLTVARGVSSERQRCHLNSLVEEYLSSPEHQLLLSLHPGVQCTVELAESLWPLRCSPVHLKKSLMNLVTNAAEAIATIGRIRIRTGEEELGRTAALKLGVEPGRYVALEISDTGSGIGKADIEHIFEPFYTRKVMGRSGTGLGLAVVWNTMQDHKGGISVTSNSHGTVFTLFFPAAPDASPPDQKETDAVVYHGAGETILVVDDEPHQRDIAGQFLELLGYRFQAAASGEEAIAYLQAHKVDLVLLDMLMGTGINGRQTYEQLIRLKPAQKALIISGFSENEEVQQALRLGAAGYLQKPYTMKNLGKAVREILHPASA